MAKRINFLTKKQVAIIVRYYGGPRKYCYYPKAKHEYDNINLHEKNNSFKWLTITNLSPKIMITFTDGNGLIIKRDYWELVNEVPIKVNETA